MHSPHQPAHVNLKLMIEAELVTVDTAIELLEKMAIELPSVGGAPELYQAVINGLEQRRRY